MSAPASARLRATGLLVAVGLVVSLSFPARSALVELKGFDESLERADVETAYTEDGLRSLLELVAEAVEELEARSLDGSEGDRERFETMAEAVRETLRGFASVAASSDEAAKAAAFPALKSLLYSVRAELEGRRKSRLVGVAIGLLRNLWLDVPFLSREERARELDARSARREAANLQDPSTGRSYIRPEELAGLTCDEVARLDVRDDHPLWHTQERLARLRAEHGSAWRALEAHTERAVGGAYSLDRARRILRFDGVKSSGTSPKIDTEDLDGRHWTLKWGDEIQAAPLASRLYVELGAKLAGIVHATDGDPAELVLVLDREGSAPGVQDCDRVADVERLKDCLRTSKYEFDLAPYIASHGVITAELVAREPFASAPADETRELIGRRFVTFHEAQVRFEPPAEAFTELGPVPFSSGGALDDRAKRALVVFAYWVRNRDAKDVNNKGFVDREHGTYLESMYDLGGSLGGLLASAHPNELDVGDAFVQRSRNRVRFKSTLLYVPKAFRRATHADAVWMVRRIAALPRETILEAVASTRWPDFQQRTIAQRLIARRNALVRAFDVDAPEIEPPLEPVVVPLGTAGERLAAVRRYHVERATQGNEEDALALLEEFLDGADRDAVHSMKRGGLETRSCKSSAIVALLESTVRPSGLSRRLFRAKDDEPLAPCRPAS